MSARASSREVKQTEFFTVKAKTPPKKRGGKSQGVVSDDEDESSSDEETSEPEEASEEDPFTISQAKVSKVKKGKKGAAAKTTKGSKTGKAKAPPKRAVKKVLDNGNLSRGVDNRGNTLFGQFLTNAMKEPAMAERVMKNFKSNRIASETELINMVLIASGCPKNAIPANTDMDSLNAEELFELMEEYLDDFDAAYPLSLKGKSKSVNIRAKYTSFFQEITVRLLKAVVEQDVEEKAAADARNTGGDNVKYLNILQVLVETLVSLSAQRISAIRDCATEASLTIGGTIVTASVERREEVAKMRRLLNAEIGAKNKNAKGGKTGSQSSQSESQSQEKETKGQKKKLSARAMHLQTTIARQEASLKVLDGLSKTVFTGVFVFRHKDFHAPIRARCMDFAGQWLAADPKKYLKDEYLKYIGWLLGDIDSSVRKSALEALCTVMGSTSQLSNMLEFVERFVDILVSTAAIDVDSSVRVFRVMALLYILYTAVALGSPSLLPS